MQGLGAEMGFIQQLAHKGKIAQSLFIARVLSRRALWIPGPDFGRPGHPGQLLPFARPGTPGQCPAVGLFEALSLDLMDCRAMW